MADFTNNLEDTLDELVQIPDIESFFYETQGTAELIYKLSPQEMDRLVSILYMATRGGFESIISKQIKDSKQQFEVFQATVKRQLQDASEDMEIKNLDKSFDVDDFCAKTYASLSGK